MSQENLVVASKVKALIKDKAGMNSAAGIMEALSSLIEQQCENAIENAKKDRRKTVMPRDFSSSN